MQTSNATLNLPHNIAAIDPKNIAQGYRERRFDVVSDADLYSAVRSVVSGPGKTLTSFTLHAPLEVMARYGLLRGKEKEGKGDAALCS